MQSLYLTIVFTLILVMLFVPLAIFVDQSGNLYQLLYKGIYKYSSVGWIKVESSILTVSLIIASLIISVISIFLFKNRKVQIRVCWILILVLVLIAGDLYLVYNSAWQHFSTVKSNLSLTSIIPLISIVLTYLAIIAIKKDEELVKSIDRIR